MSLLASKVVLVSGATKGLGAAIARAAAGAGAALALAGRNAAAGQQLAAELRDGGAPALFVPLADEIADFVIFLLSDRSGVVTGSVIDWDQNVLGGRD